jgi:hypothetical protein
MIVAKDGRHRVGPRKRFRTKAGDREIPVEGKPTHGQMQLPGGTI